MDPYQVLGVSRRCGPEELKEAFRTKALFAHPDRGGDDGDFIRLRQAYDQIVSELKRKPSPSTGSSWGDTHSGFHRQEPDPNWEPDLIVLDEPLPRVRPGRPPEPGWEPDLIGRDEPLPRIRPPRPPDANWKPDLIVGEGDTGHGPVPPLSPDHGPVAEQYVGWLRGVVMRSETEAPTDTREGWYALAGLTVLASVVILGIWMASPSETDKPPAKPSDLTSSPWPEPLPGTGKTSVPDSPDSSSRIPQVPVPDRPNGSTGTGQLLPR